MANVLGWSSHREHTERSRYAFNPVLGTVHAFCFKCLRYLRNGVTFIFSLKITHLIRPNSFWERSKNIPTLTAFSVRQHQRSSHSFASQVLRGRDTFRNGFIRKLCMVFRLFCARNNKANFWLPTTRCSLWWPLMKSRFKFSGIDYTRWIGLTLLLSNGEPL